MNNYYLTTDLYLAAFLRTKGFKFQFEKSTKSFFKFEETPELIKNVDEYLNSEAICDPLLFTNSIKNIKSLLYNKK
jgi:hypothetical protein